MGSGVFIHCFGSTYADRPAEWYQFPRQNRGRVEACVGDWIVYYEPRKVVETRGYFAIAEVERIVPDPTAPGMFLALIEPGGRRAEVAAAHIQPVQANGPDTVSDGLALSGTAH